MHVHNHPQVVAHDVKHEYIRVCCVLWGFPYTDAIIQPILPTYTFPYIDAITDEIYIERYGKHYTCMKVGERKRDNYYTVSNEKELQKVLNEMNANKNK